MISWFARNHVAANLLMLMLLFLGITSLNTRIPLEVFPSFEPRTVTVSVSLRGATPEEVEESVAIRIEESVQDLEGIKKIRSTSSEGSANVSLEIEDDYDPDNLLAAIKSRVDAINTFPSNAEKPVVSLTIRTREVISVALSGSVSEKEMRQQAERVRDELLRLPEITQVQLDDVRDYEIAIEVSEHKLRQYTLSLSEIATAINNSSLDLSAGDIKTEGGDVSIRLKGQAYNRTQYENIVVANSSSGSIIRLGDIANVVDGFVEDPLYASFNGAHSIQIEVYRVGNQSAINVAGAVKDYIAAKQLTLPSGLTISYWRDRSQIVEKRLQTLLNSALQGGILVLILLALFLRPTVALWVFVGIPVSFMGAFLVMPMLGITLNIVSLFGFIMVLGIVVDDAIVTGENIYRHIEYAEDGESAAINGTLEVAAPVTFGVLTTIVAFLPMTMIEGERSGLFAQIAVVIIPILLFSLIESKFVLPSHLKHIKINRNKDAGKLSQLQQKFAKGFESSIIKYYRPALTACLDKRHITLPVFIGIFLIIMSLVFSGWTRFVYFPRVESETIRMKLVMPTGTPFEVTDFYIQQATDQAIAMQGKHFDEATGEPIIINIYASAGGNKGSNIGQVRFEITSPEDRSTQIKNADLVAEWRQLIGQIPGAEEISFRSEIGHSSTPINIQLSGNNFEDLAGAGERIKAQLSTYEGVFDITDSNNAGKEEVRMMLKPQAYILGITEADVISQVREAFYGFEAQRIQRGRNDIRVIVRYPKEERQAMANLQNFRITTAQGSSVPVAEVVELIPGTSPTTIYRNDMLRTLNVTADINKEVVNMSVINADLKSAIDNILLQYPGLSYSLEGEAKEQTESFGSLQYGLIFVFFAIYSLLAIPFKSYAQPLIVMSIIPFGTMGAIIGHWIMGMPLTMFSILGMLALVGVVVNDSLVMVDFINQQRRKHGRSVWEAIQTAGVARFRPVMLTSLTTFFGLLPLLFEQSTQAQFLIPMAVSLGFGIIFATAITLILVPVNYLLAWECKQWLKGGRAKQLINTEGHES